MMIYARTSILFATLGHSFNLRLPPRPPYATMVNAVASSSRTGRSNGSARRSPDAEGGEAEEERLVKPKIIYEEGWTVDTFVSRPLKKADMMLNKAGLPDFSLGLILTVCAQIRSLQADTESVIFEINEGLDRAKDIAIDVEECNEDDPVSSLLPLS